MIGDYPNLPEADNQPRSQQPLILPGYAHNAQEPFLDVQPTMMDTQQPLDMQQTFAQQPFPNAQQPFPDMQQPFAQEYHSQFGYPYAGTGSPEHLIYGQPSSSSTRPFAKLVNLWRSDPAYKVLFIALATVLISGTVCMLLISNQFKQQPSSSQTAIADKTAEMSSPSSANYPTSIALPTPTPLPIPTSEQTTPPPPPASIQLTVDITHIPSTVINNTATSLVVTTNEPRVQVALYVTYSNASPASYKGILARTNSNGQATLSWPVRIRPTKKSSNVTAHVTIFAQDTNGQTATSQTVTIQVLTFQAG